MTGKTTFRITEWRDEFAEALPNGRLTTSTITKVYEGDIECEGRLRLSVTHKSNGDVLFAGFETVEGTIGGRKGRFVVEEHGGIENGVVTGNWSVIDGMSDGELQGLAGRAAMTGTPDGLGELTFDFNMPT